MPNGATEIRLELEGKDLLDALDGARKCATDWKSCQALAEVASHTKDAKQFDKIIQESLDAARKQTEPNRIVTVAAWPVSVMVARAHPLVASTVAELLTVVASEPNSVRRGDALRFLFEAVYFNPKERSNVLGVLVKTCGQMNSWKKELILAEAAMTLALDDPVGSERVFEIIGECKFSRGARRAIESGRVGPHRFIPNFMRVPQGNPD